MKLEHCDHHGSYHLGVCGFCHAERQGTVKEYRSAIQAVRCYQYLLLMYPIRNDIA